MAISMTCHMTGVMSQMLLSQSAMAVSSAAVCLTVTDSQLCVNAVCHSGQGGPEWVGLCVWVIIEGSLCGLDNRYL